MTYHQKILNCDQEGGGGEYDFDKTKSNWRYDHRSFDAIQETETKAENKKP